MACDVRSIDQKRLSEDGFALVRRVLDTADVDRLICTIDEYAKASSSRCRSGYAARNLLSDVPAIAHLANSSAMIEIAHGALGENASPVRGILFDKVGNANWHIGWHQDTMIPVAEQKDVDGFGPWSVKAGVVHVRPPADVMADVIALRVHLDDCDFENGPLRVLPGSHRHGFLSSDQVKHWMASRQAVTCTACRGDVLAMRPLLLHASSRAESAGHRRVIHIEYAAAELPSGLRWGVA